MKALTNKYNHLYNKSCVNRTLISAQCDIIWKNLYFRISDMKNWVNYFVLSHNKINKYEKRTVQWHMYDIYMTYIWVEVVFNKTHIFFLYIFFFSMYDLQRLLLWVLDIFLPKTFFLFIYWQNMYRQLLYLDNVSLSLITLCLC